MERKRHRCKQRLWIITMFLVLGSVLIPWSPAQAAPWDETSWPEGVSWEDSLEDMELTEEEEKELEALFSDLEFSETMEGQKPDGERVWIQPELSYNGESGMWDYHFPNNSVFSASMPGGFLTSEPVLLNVMDNAYRKLTRDDQMMSIPEDGYLHEPGAYHLQLHVYNDDTDTSDLNIYCMDYYIQIIPSRYRSGSVIQVPEGFEIAQIMRNDHLMEQDEAEWTFLEQDGMYQIIYRHKESGTTFSSSFYRDTTAPFLFFDQEVSCSFMEVPVSYEISEPLAQLQVVRDGIRLDEPEQTLTVSGSYQFLVTDEAGNSRYYRMKTKEKLLNAGVRELILAIVVFPGAGIYLIYRRNDIMV